MAKEKTNTSTSAKILYQPVGLISSLIAGLIASAVFKQVWQRASPSDAGDPPKPLESEYPVKELLVASLVQGAIFAVVKAATARGGARAFDVSPGSGRATDLTRAAAQDPGGASRCTEFEELQNATRLGDPRLIPIS